ncbi:hypothetical protein [Zavarzinella formosa]|uniref:hypothetical protein n=1 Tax=Zavarzinella formosa TaxID=360055 RepID=UPI00031BD850|nr:hypothetical protein [Zavarzinella formosa]
MAKTKDSGPKPRNDAYTGLLAISFLSLVGATVLMAMDASDLGTPPAPFKVDAPGSTPGKSGESFKRTDTNKVDTTPNPEPKAPEPKADPMPPMPMPEPKADPKGAVPEPKAMSQLKPMDVDVPVVVVPPPAVKTGASEAADGIEVPKVSAPKVVEPSELPPVTVKPFTPPM